LLLLGPHAELSSHVAVSRGGGHECQKCGEVLHLPDPGSGQVPLLLEHRGAVIGPGDYRVVTHDEPGAG
jgi:hypothetical protein